MMKTHSILKHDAPEFSPNARAQSLNPDAVEFTASPKRSHLQSKSNSSYLNPLSSPFNPSSTPSPVKQAPAARQAPMMQHVVRQPQPQPQMVMPQPDFRQAANNYAAPMMMPLPPPAPVQPHMMNVVDGPPPPPPGAGFDSYDVYDEYAAFDSSTNGAANEDVEVAAGPPQAPQQLQQAAPPRPVSTGPVPRPPVPPRPQPPGANANGNGSTGFDDYQANELHQRLNWQEEKLGEYANLLQSRDDQIRQLEEEKLHLELQYEDLHSRYRELRDEYKKQTRRFQQELTALRYDNQRARQQRQYPGQYGQQHVQGYDTPERPKNRGERHRTAQSNGHHISNGYSAFTSDLSEYGHGPAHLSPTRPKPSRAHNQSPTRSAGSASGNETSVHVVTAIKNFRATQPEELDLVALEEYYPVKNGMTTGTDSMVEVTSKSGKSGWVPASYLTPV